MLKPDSERLRQQSSFEYPLILQGLKLCREANQGVLMGPIIKSIEKDLLLNRLISKGGAFYGAPCRGELLCDHELHYQLSEPLG